MIVEIVCSCALRIGKITTSCAGMRGDMILEPIIVDEDFVDFLHCGAKSLARRKNLGSIKKS